MEPQEELKAIFKDLGLTSAAATVYLTLLKKGKLTASQIASETKLNRSHLYKILENLIVKGLVFTVVEKKVKYFLSLEPTRLNELIKLQITSLENKKKKIGGIISLLKKIPEKKETEFSVEVYEGIEEIKRMLEKFCIITKSGDITYSFGTEDLLEQVVGTYWWRNHLKKSRKKRVGFMGVWGSLKNLKGSKKKFREIKYIKQNLGKIEVNIYKNIVRFFLFTEKPKVILIRNKEIAEGFKSYFDFLWKKAK